MMKMLLHVGTLTSNNISDDNLISDNDKRCYQKTQDAMLVQLLIDIKAPDSEKIKQPDTNASIDNLHSQSVKYQVLDRAIIHLLHRHAKIHPGNRDEDYAKALCNIIQKGEKDYLGNGHELLGRIQQCVHQKMQAPETKNIS